MAMLHSLNKDGSKKNNVYGSIAKIEIMAMGTEVAQDFPFLAEPNFRYQQRWAFIGSIVLAVCMFILIAQTIFIFWVSPESVNADMPETIFSARQREFMVQFLAGLWAITGYFQEPLSIRKGHKGSTVYSLRRKISILVNSLTSFSNRPLIMIFYLGSSIIVAAGVMMSYLIFRK